MQQAIKERRIKAVLADSMTLANIRDLTGLSHGQVFSTLVILEAKQKVISEWAELPYPRRRFYRLSTREGNKPPSIVSARG